MLYKRYAYLLFELLLEKHCSREFNKLPTTIEMFEEFFACFCWKILESVSTSEEQIESELHGCQVDYF